MGFFDFLNEKEEVEYRSYVSNDPLKDLLNPEALVSEKDIMNIPTAVACLNVIAGTISALPIYLYRENDKGERERVFSDYRERLLNEENNEFGLASAFKFDCVKNMLLHGASYSYLDKKANEIVAIHPLETQKMMVDKHYKRGFILSSVEYTYNGEGGQAKFKDYELMKFLKDSKDGVTGKGVLETGKRVINTILSENEYQEAVYNNGAMPLGALQTDGRLRNETIQTLRQSWNNLYGGMKNAGKVVILEEGLKFTPLTLNPNDLQLKDSKKEHRSEICKLFGVPESMVISEANKYASLEANNLHFLLYCLRPLIESIENGLNKSLLLEDEKEDGYYFLFDTSELQRTTMKDHYEAIRVKLDSGIASINECRQELNLPSIPDNFMKWSLGHILYDQDKNTLLIPNMGSLMSTDGSMIINSKDGDLSHTTPNVGGKAVEKDDSSTTTNTETSGE